MTHDAFPICNDDIPRQPAVVTSDLSLLHERTPEGVAERLGAFARSRTGAVETVLWLVERNGQLRSVSSPDLVGNRQDLGFGSLPTVGTMESAPPPWRGRRAYAAFAIASSDALLGVLALGFDGAVPSSVVSDPEFCYRLALAAAVLERHVLGAALATAQHDAVARVGAGLAHTLGNVLQAAISSVDHAQSAGLNEAKTSLVEASRALKRASGVMRQLATLAAAKQQPAVAELFTPPVSDRPTVPAPATTGSARAEGQSFCVLVADDEPAVLRSIQRLLVSAGYRVCAARNGIEAVAAVRDSQTIDVALVDLTMPSLSGPALITALRQEHPDLPVVVMTGYATDEMVQALCRAGASTVLKKPIAGGGLMQVLSRAVEHKRVVQSTGE